MEMEIFGMKLICHGQNCLATYVSGEDVLCETDKPSKSDITKIICQNSGPMDIRKCESAVLLPLTNVGF